MMLGIEMAMEEGDLEISGCSSSTSSIDEDIGGGWTNWASPVVDWGPFAADDDFHGLIESMMCDDGNPSPLEPSPCSSLPASSTTTTSSGGEEEENGKGLRLVHLLMAAAEALAEPQMSRDLARVILVRLKELVPPAKASAGGNNMERLAAHFTEALQGLLDGGATAGRTSHREDQHHHHHHPGDVLAAFQLLQDMSPYVKFGHFTANQAILESVSGDRRVHVVDYDIMEGVQWASLMQAMVSRKDGGPPPPHLRITAVTRGGARRGLGTVQETGRRLVAFAASVGQPFSFGQCRLDPDEKFRPAGVKVVKGEALVANCVLHPPHHPQRAAGSVASFLAGAAALRARVVTVVEEEAEGGGEEGFVGRFMDELHRYSAVWDSLEAGFPMQGRARGLVERVILGPRIAGAVGRAYRPAAAEGGWAEWMAGMGFGRVGISCFNHCQARLLLGLFNDGYRVEEAAPNKIVLAWKARRLLSASVWSAQAAAAAAVAPQPSSGDFNVNNMEDSDDFFS